MKAKTVVSPDGALSFLFGICALMIWYTNIQYPTEVQLLTAGTLWVVVSLGMLAASFFNMARGKLRGNINVLSSLLLGLLPGTNAIISLLARIYGFSYHPVVMGVIYLVGAVFVFAIGVRRLDRPAYRSLGTFALSGSFVCLGLGDIFLLPGVMELGGWLCLLFALYIFYYGLSVTYFYLGRKLPQGPVLRRRKNSDRLSYELDEEPEGQMVMLSSFQDPGVLLAFVSVVFGLLNFMGALWSFPLDDELAMGVVRLLLGVVHFLFALVLLFQGNPYGNITLMFSVCFALFSGGRKVLQVLSAFMAPDLYGLLQLFAGVYVLLLVPAMKDKKGPYVLSGLGLSCFGLSELVSMPVLSVAAGWLFLVFAGIHLKRGVKALIGD